MKIAILSLALAAPALAFVPTMPAAKTQTRMQMSQAPMPGLASTPGQQTIEMWLMDNADPKLGK